MANAWRGLLLSAVVLILSGCDWEELKRAAQRPPENEPVPCTLSFIPMGRTQYYFKLGPIENRRVELYINEALIWTSEDPDRPKGWATYHNGVLRYMSFEDFEEIRLEERDTGGIKPRESLQYKVLNGEGANTMNDCGAKVPRPAQLYFEFLAVNP
ncbi:MAG: hypothetical protein KF767_12135 [Bdellovibrionaceae bacterium]|nr:hypothetical protein [Pseudobdellovibrionaceae bacterium]